MSIFSEVVLFFIALQQRWHYKWDKTNTTDSAQIIIIAHFDCARRKMVSFDFIHVETAAAPAPRIDKCLCSNGHWRHKSQTNHLVNRSQISKQLSSLKQYQFFKNGHFCLANKRFICAKSISRLHPNWCVSTINITRYFIQQKVICYWICLPILCISW